MKKSALILLASCLFSCNTGNEEDTPVQSPKNIKDATTLPAATTRLKELGWLDGGWKMSLPDGVLTERWRTMSDTEMIGSSELISEKGDTMFAEKIRIVLRNNILWYMPTIPNQNDGKEVAFKEKSVSATQIVFENMQHDYPQRIIYNKKSIKEMHARIEGSVSGIIKGEDFNFNRLLNQ